MKAVKDLYPTSSLRIQHSISKGFYCEIDNLPVDFNLQVVSDIETRMRQIIELNMPFVNKELPVPEVLDLFRENRFFEKEKLFQHCPTLYTSVYFLDNQVDYFYGYLVPSTGYLKVFDLVKYYDGMLLRLPQRQKPELLQPISEERKLFDIFQEYKSWCKIIKVENIGAMNEIVVNGQEGELIKIAEALHEKKVAQIADMIKGAPEPKRMILIAGPSSSGKTTFAKRLAVQLMVGGLKPIQISLDNYFVNRVDTPKDENGEYDFESINALDIDLFTQNFIDLIDGKEVDLPTFSFEKGERIYNGKKLKITDEHVIIVEGIHALNPKLSQKIDKKYKFKIYISALTQLGIDSHNRIPTTDNRLLRRMIRDAQYRGYSAIDTIKRWESVRRGEDKYIFPFQEEANIIFNSALIYELGVLKPYAEKLLKQIPEKALEFSEAQRLLKFLSYFKSIVKKANEIPPTSILREFLTGSAFSYK
jgi:uridine kinase